MTAKKKDEKTREFQYSEILGKQGVALSACSVIGSRFSDATHAHRYHYDLMNAHAEYLLFDSYLDGAVIVVARPEHADKIRAIAEQAGGTEYTPNLK